MVGGAFAVKKVAKRHEQRVMQVAWSVAFIIGEGIFFFSFSSRFAIAIRIGSRCCSSIQLKKKKVLCRIEE